MPDKEPCNGCRNLDERVTRIEQLLFGYSAPAEEARDASPIARSMADLVTPRQLGNIRRLARLTGTDPDVECRELHGCDTSEVNRNAADALITRLARLAGGRRQT